MVYVTITEKLNNMNKRDFKISINVGEWFLAEATDSYGNEYSNYFECLDEANDWIYYIWEQEDLFNSTNSQELLASAIAECVKIDEQAGREPALD